MNDDRPNPDELLQNLSSEEKKESKGSLKIYLGYAAGVGKSYAMLKGAHELKKQGIDVVVGYIEAHGRPETEELLIGLEQISIKVIEYNGLQLKELDIDAVLARKPQVVLVDELAHSNPGSARHPKRWQDINEILEAGISVYTTVNVQHLASLNDIIAQVTGVQVRETVPDSFFDKADEVTLVDISPDELLKRLRAGKVYREAQAERALGNYFRKTNLVALREIALRRTAERVHADVTAARNIANVQTILPTHERLAVMIDGDEASAAAIRACARLAAASQCEWVAVSVDSARQLTRTHAAEARHEKNVRQATELGAKIVHISGAWRVWELLRWARSENITKLVIGRPYGYNLELWLERVMLFFAAGDIDILWVHPTRVRSLAIEEEKEDIAPRTNYRAYIETTIIMLGAFIVSAVLSLLEAPEANLAVVYILGVIAAAVIHGQGASAWAAFLAAVILSFGLSGFEWRVSWQNTGYLFNFGISLGIGLLASTMTSRLRNQAEMARRDREESEALYFFSNLLASTSGLHQIIATAQNHLSKVFGHPTLILLPDSAGGYRPIIKGHSIADQNPAEWAVANWAAQHKQSAGRGTQTLPSAAAIYLPLKGAEGVMGVLGIVHSGTPSWQEQTKYTKYTDPLALKLESVQVAESAQQIYWQAERERLRGDLLSSVSEGLKTPLAILAATSASLADNSEELPQQQRQEMIELIRSEAVRLERVVENLTQLTKYELGRLPITTQEVELNEYVQAQVYKLKRLTNEHKVEIALEKQPVYVRIDPLLFAQVIFNIIDNAVQYSPLGSKIKVGIHRKDNSAHVYIEDDGEGIPEEQIEKIFEKYYRLSSRSHGAGLGLTVCKAIVEAHQGRLWAENKAPKGLRLNIALEAI